MPSELTGTEMDGFYDPNDGLFYPIPNFPARDAVGASKDDQRPTTTAGVIDEQQQPPPSSPNRPTPEPPLLPPPYDDAANLHLQQLSNPPLESLWNEEEVSEFLIKQDHHPQADQYYHRNDLEPYEADEEEKNAVQTSTEYQWGSMYRQLVSFRLEFGHTDVSKQYDAIIPGLADWVVYNRKLGQENLLEWTRKERLEQIGFSWGFKPRKVVWDEQFEKLELFKEKHGNTCVPRIYEPDPSLGTWVKNQRYRYRSKVMKAQEQDKLDSIGFDWGRNAVKSNNWEKQFVKLKEFFGVHGHSQVPSSHEDDPGLAEWVQHQRSRRRQGKMNDEQEAKLKTLNFAFNPKRGRPSKRPLCTDDDSSQDAPPVKRIRLARQVTDKKDSSVNPEDATSLTGSSDDGSSCPSYVDSVDHDSEDEDGQQVSVSGSSHSSGSRPPWDEMYSRLCEYKEKHQTLFVTRKHDRALSTWVDTQRTSHRAGTVVPDRRGKLDAIGFAWDIGSVKEQKWEDMYQRLVLFKLKHGHTKVSKDYAEDLDLAHWAQRQYYHAYKIAKRADKLESIGFRISRNDPQVMKRQEERWDEMFGTLCEYQREHGDTFVQRNYEKYSTLYSWVERQRTCYRNGELLAHREKKLESISFEWYPAKIVREGNWDKMFQKLTEYKEVHGDCNVPRHYQEDRTLGGWVGRNRHQGRQNQLSQARKDKLDSIGFNWGEEKEKDGWDKNYSKLLKFRERFGNCKVPLKWAEDTTLANWVKYQRQRQKMGLMPSDEYEKLAALGFTWCKPRGKYKTQPGGKGQKQQPKTAGLQNQDSSERKAPQPTVKALKKKQLPAKAENSKQPTIQAAPENPTIKVEPKQPTITAVAKQQLVPPQERFDFPEASLDNDCELFGPDTMEEAENQIAYAMAPYSMNDQIESSTDLTTNNPPAPPAIRDPPTMTFHIENLPASLHAMTTTTSTTNMNNHGDFPDCSSVVSDSAGSFQPSHPGVSDIGSQALL